MNLNKQMEHLATKCNLTCKMLFVVGNICSSRVNYSPRNNNRLVDNEGDNFTRAIGRRSTWRTVPCVQVSTCATFQLNGRCSPPWTGERTDLPCLFAPETFHQLAMKIKIEIKEQTHPGCTEMTVMLNGCNSRLRHFDTMFNAAYVIQTNSFKFKWQKICM